MARVALRVLTVALAVIGLASVAGWLWPVARRAPPKPDALSFVSSPDGKFKAALAAWFGGGAISPYCYDRVFVVPEGTAANRVVDDENVVFEGDCGFFAPKDGRVLNSPELSWRDARMLVVRFSILGTVAKPAAFRFRRQVASGQVVVEFEVGQ